MNYRICSLSNIVKIITVLSELKYVGLRVLLEDASDRLVHQEWA